MSGKIIMAKEIAKKLIARQRGIQLGLSVNTDTLSNSEENEHLCEQTMKSRSCTAENADLTQGQASETVCC